jgi:DNA-binding CsgD family transcriptional regulator
LAITPTEKEIALLLGKGLSMQEIVDIRHVKRKSVRQQSTGIYTRAGVANRHELSAYFIEDLLLPVAH